MLLISLDITFMLDQGIIEVTAAKKVTMPKLPPAKAIYWSTPGNKLTTMNPRQTEFAFRDVSSAAAETRSVA